MQSKQKTLARYFYYFFVIIVVLVFLSTIILLFAQSLQNIDGLSNQIKHISRWFDPIFFQYNLLLVTITVSITPLITLFYIHKMKTEKIRRLKAELPDSIIENPIEWRRIIKCICKTFEFRNFSGSIAVLTLFIMMGSMIIMLLKPMPLTGSGTAFGVDYTKGSNFLMSGPYIFDYMQGNNEVFIKKLVYTQTAFQFGFLGAYIYFIRNLVRSYFTLDITPDMFVASTIRIVMGSVLALVLSFVFIDIEGFKNQGWLPIISFFIGFFPERGLLMLEKLSIGLINLTLGRKLLDREAYNSTALSELPGMSFQHELRLNREGYDNIENFKYSDPVELAIHTGFQYQQLDKWVLQAKLLGHLGKDYKEFVVKTGITGIDDLKSFCETCSHANPPEDAYKIIANIILPEDHRVKIKVLCTLYSQAA